MDWLGIPDYQRLLDIELNRAQDLMGRLEEQSGSDLSGTNWETEVIGTAHAKAIADVASTREADEIIVGTRGYGRARALLGSVAHAVHAVLVVGTGGPIGWITADCSPGSARSPRSTRRPRRSPRNPRGSHRPPPPPTR
jgi:hypothetical protein